MAIENILAVEPDLKKYNGVNTIIQIEKIKPMCHAAIKPVCTVVLRLGMSNNNIKLVSGIKLYNTHLSNC